MSQELAHFCLPSRLSHGVGNWGTAAIGIVSMEEGSPIPGVGASRDRAPVRSPIIVGQVLEMLTAPGQEEQSLSCPRRVIIEQSSP